MQRSFLSVVPALWLLLAGCTSVPKPVDSGQLVFWEVRPAAENGASAHVLGSVHFGRAALHFDPAIETALAEADVLVFEVAPDEMDPLLVQGALAELGRLPPGRSLADELPEKTWRALRMRLELAGLPPDGLAIYEPWVAMIQVIGLDMAAAGFQSEQGVEQQLLKQAGGQPSVGLETARFQLELFDGLPRKTQISMLEDALATGASKNALHIDLILEAWRVGDLDLLQRVMNPEPDDPEAQLFHERVFTARNRHMADGLAALLTEPKRYFVTVGAGHTIGDDGVPALLRARGFRVRRIPRSEP